MKWGGAGHSDPFATMRRYQYVRSQRYIDAPVLRDENQDGDDYCNDDERLYYLTDANMNVTALVRIDGIPVERYIYDPYGKVTILNGAFPADKDGMVTEWSEDTVQDSDVDNAILFAGYYRDSDTGLYHVRHRAYHPNLGRWLQRDPLGYVDGMSLYEYVRSAPTFGIDPFGREQIVLRGKAIIVPKTAPPDSDGSGRTHVEFSWELAYERNQAGKIVNFTAPRVTSWVLYDPMGIPDHKVGPPDWIPSPARIRDFVEADPVVIRRLPDRWGVTWKVKWMQTGSLGVSWKGFNVNLLHLIGAAGPIEVGHRRLFWVLKDKKKPEPEPEPESEPEPEPEPEPPTDDTETTKPPVPQT